MPWSNKSSNSRMYLKKMGNFGEKFPMVGESFHLGILSELPDYVILDERLYTFNIRGGVIIKKRENFGQCPKNV